LGERKVGQIKGKNEVKEEKAGWAGAKGGIGGRP